MTRRQWWVAGIVLALAVKIGLFSFIALTRPETIIENDSREYLSCAATLADGFRGQDISRVYDTFRTPGYPFFLMVFHVWLQIPLMGIIGLHLILNILTAWIVSRAARRIDPRLVPISVLVILLDFPTTVFSLLLMTEALCIFVMSIFLYSAVRFLQDHRWRWVIVAGLSAGIAALVRPAAYYFPLMVCGLMFLWAFFRMFRADAPANSSSRNVWGIVFDGETLKRLAFMLVFLLFSYASILGWQYRNYVATGQFEFSKIDNATIKMHGLIGRYARGDNYNKVDAKSMNPVVYYVYTTSRHVIELMTEPASLKYFHSSFLRKAGNVFGYLIVLFWMPGFLAGLWKMGRSLYFWLMAMTVFYFMAITILAVGWETTPRFRVPMMPFIAILSAYGWILISGYWKNRGISK